MNTRTLQKKQTAFRLNSALIDRLKILAKRENRSLSNYVECVLFDAAYREPNDETIAAIEEAKSGKFAGKLDTASFETFMKSVNEIE